MTDDPGATQFLRLKNPRQLARFLDVRYDQHLVYTLYKIPTDRRYTTFEIKKKGGGTRTIQRPTNTLKIMQQRISTVLQAIYEPKASVHGYCNGRSIVTNAQVHRRPRYILNIDLSQFFKSINFGRIRGMFIAAPFRFPAELATVLAQLSCHDNGLPLGAPTSPVISNIICSRLDRQLRRFAQSHLCRYTRYADDMTFSTRRPMFPDAVAIVDSTLRVTLGAEIESIIASNGFTINHSKTRLLGRTQRQEVTGLVVNDLPNLRRADVRRIRAMIHAWGTYGHDMAQQEYFQRFDSKSRCPNTTQPTFEEIVRGKIAFFKSIKGETDSVYLNLAKRFNRVARTKIMIRDLIYILERDVWVIEDEEAVLQGTGFFLKDWDFITCAHCVGRKPYIFNPLDPSKKFQVAVIGMNEVLDIARLRVVGGMARSGMLSGNFLSEPESQDDVRLVGYPNYAPDKTISIRQGKVTSFARRFGSRRLNISAAIVFGNSGGPVLDRQDRVIGIAVTGVDREEGAGETDEHGVIPIEVLKQLAPADTGSEPSVVTV